MNKVKHQVFWPAFTLLFFALLLSILYPSSFLNTVKALNDQLLKVFGSSFSVVVIIMVFTTLLIWFSPLGKIKIGGELATPLLNRWRWFAITLCTTIATGILFWGSAEPIYHFSSPPQSSGIPAETEDAAVFAMSTVYLHWTFTPYAIYTVPTVAFALAFYNYNSGFSLASMLFPFFGKKKEILKPNEHLSTIVDVVCLFALVAGMSASLGTGVLTLAGGLNYSLGIEKNQFLIFIICLVTVTAFVISASSGLMKGIRILSSINVYAFIVIALFILFLGPIQGILSISLKGLGAYITGFFEKNLYNVVHPGDAWANNWTVFFWANWMAWAPISAMFLGRISRGYRVRELILFNWVIPALFSMLWMSIFSGTALSFQLDKTADLTEVLNKDGYESVIYAIMNSYPFKAVLSLFFIFIVFLSYVTAADSNTEAMSAMSTKNISADSASAPMFLKIIWGVLIGATAYIMISAAGVEGIKMLSNLGGLPALLLLTAVTLGMLILSVRSFFKK